MIILLLFLTSIPLTFPETSAEFAHFITPPALAQVGYEGSGLIIDWINPEMDPSSRDMLCIVLGVGFNYFMYRYTNIHKHYTTERELALANTGIILWMGTRVTIWTIRLPLWDRQRKKKLIATAENELLIRKYELLRREYLLQDSTYFDEIIEFYPKEEK